jgi:hypothetical protein
VAHVERRLQRLEAARARHDAPAWTDVNAALDRQTARIRLVVGERLGTEAEHFALVAAREILGEDTPAREAANRETITRWHRVHGLRDDTGDVRQRLLLRLEAIARRIRNQPSPPPSL